MYQENPKKWIFILLNIKEEDMGKLYECEFTVEKNKLDDTNRGKPTKLLPGQFIPVKDSQWEQSVFHCELLIVKKYHRDQKYRL